jgi:CubicO group peptidase (beta-lactamase class C family)
MTMFSKRMTLAAAVVAIAIAVPAAAQEAAGNWVGVLEPVAGTKLPLVVHIKRDDAGVLTGTLDSPSQGAMGIPLDGIKAEAGSLSFTIPLVSGSYTARWDATAKAWKGQWSQSGQTWPLDLTAAPPPRALPADWLLPPDSDIAKIIADRNAPRFGQGIVIGVLSPEGRRFVAGGTGAGAAVNRDTLYEIGSITKVFTALILADMVNKGEVSLDDPAAKFLPPGHRMPERNGRQITLRDLATHRSGLPRMPDNIGEMTDPDGPFARYDEAKLLAFLDRYQLPRDIGSEFEYSNLAVGLLGYLLGRAAHSDYPTLLRQRVTGPLGMKDTMIALPPSHAGRLVPAFDTYMRPAKPWDIGVLTAAGGIRSSAADMLTFANAVMDPKSPIAAAMKTALSVRAPGPSPRAEQALGWVILHPSPGRELQLHDGGTGGFRTLIALEPAKSRAVVVLVNSAGEPSATDLGLHVLVGGTVQPTPPVPPAPPPPVKHTEITLPPAELTKFTGRYAFDQGFEVAITLENGVLRVQRLGVPGAPALPIFPEAPLVFFWKAVDAQISFTVDASGAVTGAVIVQSGQTFTGKRVKTP